MSNGWIKLHRGILDWEWYDDANTFRLFLHILLTANHADKKWRGITIRKGQKLTSQLKLSEQTGLTRQQVRTCLTRLESTNEITMQSNAQSTMITVLQWDKYQGETSESTNEQPAANQLSTTNKNDKNEKKDILSGLSPELLMSISDHWNQYMTTQPKVDLVKVSQANKKRWSKIKKILADYPDYVDHEYWKGHIQMLATLPDLEWQRNNKQLTFDQAVQLEKFDRNLGYMRMTQQ